jgi:ABC-type amino acid transport system permease subunit
MVPGLIATVIFVLPAPIRLTCLGVSTTPTTLLEAATAFGATPSQRLWKVELPFAFPQIMAGLNQTIMLSLSMVVIAAYVGADGLGKPVVQALMSALGPMADMASPPEGVAEVIYQAAPDGTDQLRYEAGADAEQLLAGRRAHDDASFLAGIKAQFGLGA